MRYINVAAIQLPDGWEEKCRASFDELVNSTPTGRKELIQKKADLWKEVKDALSTLSHGKCWYCETKQIRSDNPVDHFRPKNKVAECENHEGYWWLAFDWNNYRYSCTYCNSRRQGTDTVGGKHDHFPLVDESLRVINWEDDIKNEQPLLLDPTNSEDPDLLWFYIDGTPKPKFNEDQDEIKHKRAKISIKLYHLDEARLEEKRRELYQSISRAVARGNEALDEAARNKNDIVRARAKQRFADVVNEIKEMIGEKAELSSEARIFLMTFSSSGNVTQGKWINQLLAKSK